MSLELRSFQSEILIELCKENKNGQNIGLIEDIKKQLRKQFKYNIGAVAARTCNKRTCKKSRKLNSHRMHTNCATCTCYRGRKNSRQGKETFPGALAIEFENQARNNFGPGPSGISSGIRLPVHENRSDERNKAVKKNGSNQVEYTDSESDSDNEFGVSYSNDVSMVD